MNPAHLATLIAETAAWCRQSDPAHRWRTPTLEPPDFLVFPGMSAAYKAWEAAQGAEFAALSPVQQGIRRNHFYYAEVEHKVLRHRQEVVARLAAQRSELLRVRGLSPTASLYAAVPLLTKYLLRCTAADESVTDGASEAESEGFFDIQDLPPWDTWLAYIVEDKKDASAYGNQITRSYLLSWVPPKMEALVTRGIEVNPVNCHEWHDEAE